MVPKLGACVRDDGIHFHLWAPAAQKVELVLEHSTVDMSPGEGGLLHAVLPRSEVGALYRYRVDGQGPFPDPVSRFQPLGVHGPSQVVDPASYLWTDAEWVGVERDQLIIYELHVGTFTPEGTYAAAAKKLQHLAELGITAIEIMPLADFPGGRNWGYDGVALYAPARCYGTPDDLRDFVDAAHGRGIAVILDVVYNHLGPDGNYLGIYSPYYFSPDNTDWGQALNFDGDHSPMVREFFIQNALYWIRDFHFDGLRLDATHAIMDEGQLHFLAELVDRVETVRREMKRHIVLIAEDERNLAELLVDREDHGYGLDGVWADDFHHQLRRGLTGDSTGYFAAYSGSAEDIATTIKQGWFYTGQVKPNLRRPAKQKPRGTDPTGIPPERFVLCIQNHDQVGNRAFGERLNHQADPSAYRAVTALLLTAPQTPMLFMGQEWAATSPFFFFTDHNADLGKLVTEGRRKEFGFFPAFSNPEIRDLIPDPQAETTFTRSKLDWAEIYRGQHAGTLRLYQDLIALRKTDPAMSHSGHHNSLNDLLTDVHAQDTGAVHYVRKSPPSRGGSELIVVVAVRVGVIATVRRTGLEVVLMTEHERYTDYVRRPTIIESDSLTIVHFPCASAVIFRSKGASA